MARQGQGFLTRTRRDDRPTDREVTIITHEEDPCFNIGTGGYIPVSRDMPPAQREIIIRELKAYSWADRMLALAGMAFVFGVITVSVIVGGAAIITIVLALS